MPNANDETQHVDHALYAHMRTVADTFFTVCTQRNEPGVNTLNFELDSATLNPTNHQTETGLFLLIEDDLPQSIFTPWGEWNFRGKGFRVGNTEGMVASFLARIDAEQVRAMQGGTLWAIHQAGEDRLSTPTWRPQAEHIDFEAAHAAWNIMRREYERTHPTK